jgi:hypothetical protein
MSSSILRFSLCALIAITLVGCGGSSNNTSSGGGGNGGGGTTNPTTVTFKFDPTGALPAVVATQIGNGTYTKATLASNVLTFTVPSGETKYAIAYLCAPFNGSSSLETIYQSTISDVTPFTGYCDGQPTVPTPTGSATLSVDVSAIPGAKWILISDHYIGYGVPLAGNTADLNETFSDGNYDVPIGVYPATGGFYSPLAVRILRNQTIPGALNGGSPLVFQTSDELTPQTVTYNSIPSGYTAYFPIVSFTSSGGAIVGLAENGPGMQYMDMPSGSVNAGDYYAFTAQASDATELNNVTVTNYTSKGGAQSLAFPAPWSYSGPTPAALPTIDYTYIGFAGMPHLLMNSDLAWYLGSQAQGYTDYDIRLLTTGAYQNGSTSVPFPDLSGVAGFLSPPPSGTKAAWIATISQGAPYLATPPSGSTQSVSTSGTYLVP